MTVASGRARASAYGMLCLAALFWAGNAVAGKLAAGELTPVALTFFRWLLASLVLAPGALRHLGRDAAQMRNSAARVFWLGAVGFSGFNFALYSALHHTTALNVTIEQSCMPVLVILGGLALHREPVQPLQLVGVGLTMLGVIFTATRGDASTVLSLGVNRGDAIMMVGVLCYAAYTLGLRRLPAVHPDSLLFGLAVSAAVVSAGFYLDESLRQGARMPGPAAWALVAYVVLFPSLLSQRFYIRGVAILGPSRAGLFVNLVPVFGALLAVVVLGEHFETYHAWAIALSLGGIAIAERFGAPAHNEPHGLGPEPAHNLDDPR